MDEGRLDFYFFPVALDKFRPFSLINFDLYIKVENRFVLYKHRNITITKDETVIVDGAGTAEAVEERRQHLRNEIERTDSRPCKRFHDVSADAADAENRNPCRGKFLHCVMP